MSSGPMYLQIAEDVRASVTNGDYRPGQVLPAEQEFMERFSVSRVTVRRALKELVDESLLESRQGSGYDMQRIMLRWNIHTAGSGLIDGPSPMKFVGSP